MTTNAASIRRALGWALVAGLSMAAVTAIVALLTGSFGETEARVIGASVGFAVMSSTRRRRHGAALSQLRRPPAARRRDGRDLGWAAALGLVAAGYGDDEDPQPAAPAVTAPPTEEAEPRPITEEAETLPATPARKKFIAEADAICAEANAAIEAEAREMLRDGPPNREEQERFITEKWVSGWERRAVDPGSSLEAANRRRGQQTSEGPDFSPGQERSSDKRQQTAAGRSPLTSRRSPVRARHRP